MRPITVGSTLRCIICPTTPHKFTTKHLQLADKTLLRNGLLQLASTPQLPTGNTFGIMLDPMSALGLACNIIQIVDFSLKAVTKFRELYKDGASSEDRELEDMTVRLKGLRANLVTVDRTIGQSRPVFVDDQDLQALADECCKTADKLTTELDTLKTSGPHKRRQAVQKFYRSICRKSVVEKIQRKLDSYQKVLDTRILVNLRSVLFYLVALCSM